MPRIPQSEFNSTPSTRVGRQNAPAIGTNSVDRVVKAGSEMMKGMAQLKDQQERTDAFLYARDSKTTYEAKKEKFELGLKSMNADGSYEYIDPMDTNPDINKRARVSGNISDTFKELQSHYNESVEGAKNLTRSDIAGEFINKQIGDNLIQSRIRMGKETIRVKGNAVVQGMLLNMDSAIQGMLDTVSSTSPDLMNKKIDAAMNEFMSEKANMGAVIGNDRSAKLDRLMDERLKASATAALQDGVTQNSVMFAQKLISRMGDPASKGYAEKKLGRLRKKIATEQNVTTLQRTENLIKTHTRSGVLEKADEEKLITAAANLKNMFIDSEFSSITRDEVNDKHLELTSLIAAKKLYTNGLEDGFSDIKHDMLSGEGLSNARYIAAIGDKIDGEVNADLLSGMLTESPEYKSAMVEKTAENLRSMFGNMKNNIANDQHVKNPKDRFGNIVRTQEAAESLGLGGGVQLIPDDNIKQFNKDFAIALNQGGEEAAQYALGQFRDVGKYGKQVGLDLAGKDPKKAYLGVSGELYSSGNYEMSSRVIEDASYLKRNTLSEIATPDGKSLKGTSLTTAFAANAGPLFRFGNSLHSEAIETATKNRAAVIIGESKGSIGVADAMSQAIKEIGSAYTAVGTEDTRVSFLSTDPKFRSDDAKELVKRGVNFARHLPDLSLSEKKHILKRSKVAVSSDVIDKMDIMGINSLMSRTVTIAPSEREGDMMDVLIGGKPIILPNKKSLQYSADKFLEFGEEQIKFNKKRNSSVWERR